MSFEAYLDKTASGRLDEAAKVVGRSKPRQWLYVAAATECAGQMDAL